MVFVKTFPELVIFNSVYIVLRCLGSSYSREEFASISESIIRFSQGISDSETNISSGI